MDTEGVEPTECQSEPQQPLSEGRSPELTCPLGKHPEQPRAAPGQEIAVQGSDSTKSMELLATLDAAGRSKTQRT